MLALALSCAAALSLASLPDDAPVADPPEPKPAEPSKALRAPSAPRPRRLLYTGGDIPPDYELVLEYDQRLLVGGTSSVILGYAAGAVFALAVGLNSVAVLQRGDPLWALLPLAGPFLALGTPAYRSLLPPETLHVRDLFLVADAAVQWLGAILAGIGYFFPTRVLQLREDVTAGAGWVVPLAPGGGLGLTWTATFGP